MINDLLNKKAKLALVGLGYVGLPIALEFAKRVSVIGYDINKERINLMNKGIDPCKELPAEAFSAADIKFTSSLDELKEASFFIIAVPTPIDKYNKPDLTPLIGATESVGKVLKRGDYVVYESTVYPGCTEEDCVPVLEKLSGLKFGKDFKVGYSPERINPGEKVHTLPNTIKIVSGCDSESLDIIAKTYELVVKPGVHRAPSVKVAEAAKIVENTQRDVNIALMNELSIIFNRIGINTYDVLEAAGTKWNFLKFYPGLVGGHCIGVDPYYLVQKASELKYHPQLINAGISQKAALFKANVTWRGTNKPAHGVLLLVFTHIEAQQFFIERLCEHTGKFCFSNAGRSNKKEACFRLVWIAEPGARFLHGNSHHFNGSILSEYFAMQCIAERAQLFFFTGCHRLNRHTRHLCRYAANHIYRN